MTVGFSGILSHPNVFLKTHFPRMAIKFTRVVRNSLRPWIYESQCRGVQGFTCCNEWAPAKKANNCSGIEFIVNKISRLASLKEIDKCKGELCGKTEIVNRYGKLISSSCNQEHWTRFEKSSIGTHFCFYVLNKFGSLERAARIFYIILTFVYRLRRSSNHHPYKHPKMWYKISFW